MIKFNEVKSATIAVSNESEESRVYGITADASLKDGTLTRLEHGRVTTLEGSVEKATFSTWNEENVNLNMNNVPFAEQPAVFEAVNRFISELREAAQPTVAIVEETVTE